MKREAYVPYRPYRREDGVLARVDETGAELRIHRDDRGRWHPHLWHADPTSPDGWRGPTAYGFTPEDLVAMGGAAMALPVAFEAPLARASGGAQDGRDDGGTGP